MPGRGTGQKRRYRSPGQLPHAFGIYVHHCRPDRVIGVPHPPAAGNATGGGHGRVETPKAIRRDPDGGVEPGLVLPLQAPARP